MKILEKEKIKYIQHRLELDDHLSHAVYMEYKEKIQNYRDQIKELDKIIEVIFKS